MKKYFIKTSVVIGIIIISLFSINICNYLFEGNNISQEGTVFFDHPYLASVQEFVTTYDPQVHKIPGDRLKEAYLQTKEFLRKNGSKKNLPIWTGTQADMGGRTRALMFDPNDPSGNKVWAGAVTGGLWYNDDITDNNSPWIPVDDFWANISVSCITFDPNNTETLYIGTGEAQTALITYRASSGMGTGIMKSVDGGITWNFLESTEGFAYVTDVRVRNESGQSVIFAAVASGKYMGEQHQSEPTDGLYRSEDGGVTWEQVLPHITGLDIPYTPSDIEIGIDGRIYVGTMPNLNEEGAATILYSDEGTLGTWTKYEDHKTIIENDIENYLPGRVMLACAPSDENIIYAEFASGRYDYGLPAFRCFHIIRSDNKGNSWFDINIPNNTAWGNWATIAWHALAIGIDPNDSEKLIIGGLDLHKSDNGGADWNVISDWTKMYSGGGNDYVHGDIHSVIFKQGSSDEAIFSTDGGVFYTSSASAEYPVFEERNKAYNTLQCYTGAMTPVSGQISYLSGHQDNGTVLWEENPVTINDMVSGGDGAYCFFDENEPEIFITSSQNNRYSIFINGELYSNITQYSGGNFICPADYDYKQNILFSNYAFFWTYNLDIILRISDIPYNSTGQYLTLPTGGSTFSHVKYSPFSSDGTSTLFLGTQAGKVFKVENANSTPVVTEIGSINFPEASVSCIAIGQSEDNLLVTFSNYGVPSVWETQNGGYSWEEREGNLPDIPVRWALYHPDNSAMAMIATELGVWTTENLNDTEVLWTPANDGLANVRVDMLKYRESDNTVLAATHGRGLFTTFYGNSSSTEDIESPDDFSFFPNPAKNFLNISFNTIEDKNIEIIISDINGKVVLRDYCSDINYDFVKRVNISNFPKGAYFVNINFSNEIRSFKFIKQ